MLAAGLCLASVSAADWDVTDGTTSALTTISAQTPSGWTTQVRFSNPTPHRRVEWGLATVPFPKGYWMPGQSFGAVGYPSTLTPFGAKWGDGSHRYGQLAVLLDLAPEEERLITVREGAGQFLPFAVSPWMSEGLKNFQFHVAAAIPGAGIQFANLRAVELRRNDFARKTVIFRGRIPQSDFIVDLGLTLFSESDHMPMELRITSSSTASSKWDQTVDGLYLFAQGAFVNIRGARRRGVLMPQQTPNGPNIITLMGERAKFFDGQGQAWWGELMFLYPNASAPGRAVGARSATLNAAMKFPLFGVSTDWAASGAFGPFGTVPEYPPWITDGGRSTLLAVRENFENYINQWGGPWDDWPLGMLANPSSPGDQHDFGAAKCVDIVTSGLPYGIEEARLSADEEAIRPVHHREANGNPVTAANHPNWVAWDGRTHFNQTLSPDRLGKPFPGAPTDANGWFGRDHEHWSSLVLASAYLLTGSDSLRYELENEAELFISSHTLPSQKPTWSSNGIGAARGVGRTLLSMSWNYLLTGNNALKKHMGARVDEVVAKQAKWNSVQGPVRPISARQPDPRLLSRPNWRPWEESLAILGLEACSQVTGNQNAHMVAVAGAITTMKWGWLLSPEKNWIATALGWKANGDPMTAAEYADPTWALWSYGTNFNEWSLSAVRLSIRYAQQYNDPVLLQRAQLFNRQLERARAKPKYVPGWDRFSEWEAVR